MPDTDEFTRILEQALRDACHRTGQPEGYAEELCRYLLNVMGGNSSAYDSMSLIERFRM